MVIIPLYANVSDRFFCLRSKETGMLVCGFNFETDNAPNSNDNSLLICFDDQDEDDAHISADRHFRHYPNWEEEFDLVEVKIELVKK